MFSSFLPSFPSAASLISFCECSMPFLGRTLAPLPLHPFPSMSSIFSFTLMSGVRFFIAFHFSSRFPLSRYVFISFPERYPLIRLASSCYCLAEKNEQAAHLFSPAPTFFPLNSFFPFHVLGGWFPFLQVAIHDIQRADSLPRIVLGEISSYPS